MLEKSAHAIWLILSCPKFTKKSSSQPVVHKHNTFFVLQYSAEYQSIIDQP